MPLQPHPDHAISFIEPNNDVAWMSWVLSQSGLDEPPLTSARGWLDDHLAQAVEAELPRLSFRLQILRAWTAANGGRGAEAAGHA